MVNGWIGSRYDVTCLYGWMDRVGFALQCDELAVHVFSLNESRQHQ
jgi:hypothetical protein